MKKILFPTDFSAAADHAFIYALKLAKKIGASITTVHCYELPTIKSNHLPHTSRGLYESMSLEEFENYKDNVPHLSEIAKRAGLQDVRINHVMQEGEAIYNILRIAKKEEPDMIVMGTTGASGLKKIFLGSVAAEVMENAPCPVLAVPLKAEFDGKMDRVAFTTEFKDEEAKALSWLNRWPGTMDASIYCVHVDMRHTEDLTHRMDPFKSNFAGSNNLHFEVIDHTFFEAAIVKFLDEKQIELLAMVIHQRNFFKELFNYSFTKNLAYHLATPILAIPADTIKTLDLNKEDQQFGLAGLTTS